MKISSVEAFVVDFFRANFVFVRIETTTGLEGFGEGSVEFAEKAVADTIEYFAPFLLGEDPFEVERLTELLNRESYWRMGIVHRSALSAIEAALLDIKGKALGVPVYDLLGGRQRDRIRCYANGWFTGARKPAEFAEKARETTALGFSALKWDPFGRSYLTLTPAERHAAIGQVEAVRDAVGPAVDLIIEAHGRFDVPTAIAVARDMEPFSPLALEEPVPPESIDALVDVRRASRVPIATGERFCEPARFLEAITRGAVDVLQPDVCHVGGLGECKRIAAIAHARFLPVSPHNPLGPVANAMTLQLLATIPNAGLLETMVSDVPWRTEVATEYATFDAGFMHIPSRPGLGVDLHPEACRRHGYVRRELRHYRGTLTDIRPADSRPYYRIAGAPDA